MSSPRPEEARETIKVNGWEHFLQGERICPLCSWCTFLCLGLFFTAVFLSKAVRVGSDIVSFEVQSVRSSHLVQEYHAFLAVQRSRVGCSDTAHEQQAVCEADDTCSWDGATCKVKEICPGPPPRAREKPMLYKDGIAWVGIIYEATHGNVFDDDVLAHIDKFEKMLLTSVDGARMDNGTLAPWNTTWCRMAYPHGQGPDAPGRCAAPDSFVNIFSMNAHGRAATRDQVMEGFTDAGPLSCMCSDVDALCPVCTADGGFKEDVTEWPEAVRDCMMGHIIAGGQGQDMDSETPSVCRQAGMGMDEVKNFLADFCGSLPSCQWAPPGGSQVCASTAFYHATDGRGLVAGKEKQQVIEKLCDENDTMWWNMRRNRLPNSFDCKKKEKRSRFASTSFVAGGSGVGKAEGEAFEKDYIQGAQGWYAKEQGLERQIEGESNGKLRIMLFSAATLRTQYLGILLWDASLSILSLSLVWGYMWWTLESAFLASCAIFEILFSLPVAAFIWSVVMQQQIQSYQVLTIYMIVGIGADDAFILYDAWVQARLEEPEIAEHRSTRFAWAYRRAFTAMFVTTLTTCGSLTIGAISPLPQVRDFSIFAAIVVFVDWLYCITFFASALIVNERFFRSAKKPGECGGPGFLCGCFRWVSYRWCTSCVGGVPPAGAPPQKRLLERFCEGPLLNVLKRGGRFFIVGWVLVVIVMVTTTGLRLRTAEKHAPLGKQNLDPIRGLELALSEFNSFGAPLAAMVFGLDPQKPLKHFGKTEDGDEARFNAEAAAKVALPEGQLELLSLCRAADLGEGADHLRCESRRCLIYGSGRSGPCPANDALLFGSGIYMPEDAFCLTGRYCFMEEFADFWAHQVAGAACVGVQNSTACVQAGSCTWSSLLGVCHSTITGSDYPGLPASEFIERLGSPEFAKYRQLRERQLYAHGRQHDVMQGRKATGFQFNAGKTALKVAFVGFNATYSKENSVEEANRWHRRWSAFHKQYTPRIGGYQTTELYLFMVIQNALVKAAVMGILLSLLVAFVVLVATTRNWWVSLLGLVSIMGIVACFLGIISLLGWSLGESECIFMIILVGLSVDYPVHLLHAYNKCEADSREERCQYALAEMGISVVNSAITTLLSAVILFGCGFYFFFQFGAFVFFVIGLSIIISISLLMPLLLSWGPQGTRGDLGHLHPRLGRRITASLASATTAAEFKGEEEA